MILIALIVLATLAVLRFEAATEIIARLGQPYGPATVHAIGVALLVTAAIFIDQFVRVLYWENYLSRKRAITTPALIKDLLTIALVVVGLSIGLAIEEGFTFTGLITASGATAVVLGIALQAAIQDLFSGLSIHLDRSYSIGDWLTIFTDQMPHPHYGCVNSITWRSTFLILEDGRRLMVPNHIMTANPVINHSRPSVAKRLHVSINVDNRVPSDRVMDMMLGEVFKAMQNPGFSREPNPDVIITHVESESVHYEARFYVWPEKISPTTARSMVLAAILDVLQKNKIPSPVSQVELTQPLDVEYHLGEDEKRGSIGLAPLFANALSTEEVNQLIETCAAVEFPRGAVLMRQGDPPSNMYLILEGAVSIQIEGAGGQNTEVAISATGDIVGEMSLMTGANRTATAVALARVRTLQIGKSDIAALLHSNPRLAERFAGTLSKRQRELDEAANRPVRKESEEPNILARMMAFFDRAFS